MELVDKSTIGSIEPYSNDEDWEGQQLPWYLQGETTVYVEDYDLSADDESTSSEPEVTTVKEPWHLENTPRTSFQVGDYWQIVKVVKYLKMADKSTTAITLAMLSNHDYSLKSTWMALVDSDALEILINLLSTDDSRCQLGSLTVLAALSVIPQVQVMLIDLGLVQQLIQLFVSTDRDIQHIAITILCNMSQLKKIRTIVRKNSGIPVLMDLMELPPGISGKREETLTGDELDIFRVGKQATIAFSLFARSPRVRKEVYHHGVLKLLPKLLSSKDQDTSLAALNVLMLCSSVPEFKTSVEAHGLISFILKNLTSGDSKREELSCRALYRLSDSELSQKQARTYKVLQALVGLMKDDTKTTKVLKYAAGSVMRCANDKENVAVLGEMSIIGTLIRLLKHKTDSVATHAAGILASLAHITSNREAIKRLNGLPVLMELMSKSHCEPLLAHVVKVIGDCAYNENCMEDLQEMDTLRLVWSLLNMRDPSVKANAAWALVPIIKRFKISGEVIRSFAGALEILINLLDHPDHRVKAGACSALAYVAYDEINLSIITDLGVVHKLCNLVTIDSDVLRENMCIAIASVSRKPSNSMELGRLGCIDPIVQFLGSKNEEVVTAAAFALWKLSSDPINCIALHKSGVVPFLLECIGSESFPLQTAAAGCLNNIRGVAYEADLIKNVGRLITVPRMKKSFRTKSVVEAVLEAEKEQVERFKESQNREDDD